MKGLRPIDFLKMDIQGAELMVLKSGAQALSRCVAVQLEVSFVPLYENQPAFGEIDVWMRAQGFAPHCFTEVKTWSIRPTIRGGDFRAPFNQLLEADIVYMRDPVETVKLSSDQLGIMALVAHYVYASTDLAIHCLLELERRAAVAPDPVARFISGLAAG